MASCPKCQTPLKDDFGLETCSGCGVVVFVNNDEVSLQDDGIPLEVNANMDSSSDLESDLVSLDSDNNDVVINEINILEEGRIDAKFEDEAFVEGNSEINSEPSLLDNVENTTDLLFDENDIEAEDSSETLSAESQLIPTSADDFLAEMKLFGEMDSEKFQDAIYFFDIEIASIDSKDIRDEILDILDDSKLNLKIDNFKQKIKNGILLLPAIPAVKAHIIVQRISHLPCEISWALVEVHDLGARDEEVLANSIEDENSNDFGLETDDLS